MSDGKQYLSAAIQAGITEALDGRLGPLEDLVTDLRQLTARLDALTERDESAEHEAETSALEPVEGEPWITPTEAAKITGRTSRYMRDHYLEFGGIRIGHGPKKRTWFLRSRVEAIVRGEG